MQINQSKWTLKIYKRKRAELFESRKFSDKTKNVAGKFGTGCELLRLKTKAIELIDLSVYERESNEIERGWE